MPYTTDDVKQEINFPDLTDYLTKLARESSVGDSNVISDLHFIVINYQRQQRHIRHLEIAASNHLNFCERLQDMLMLKNFDVALHSLANHIKQYFK